MKLTAEHYKLVASLAFDVLKYGVDHVSENDPFASDPELITDIWAEECMVEIVAMFIFAATGEESPAQAVRERFVEKVIERIKENECS